MGEDDRIDPVDGVGEGAGVGQVALDNLRTGSRRRARSSVAGQRPDLQAVLEGGGDDDAAGLPGGPHHEHGGHRHGHADGFAAAAFSAARMAAMTPPSMSRSEPVMKEPSGPRRRAAASATSDGVPIRPAAEVSIMCR